MFGIKKNLKKKNLLELVPLKLVGSEVREDGKATLLIPRFKSKFLLNFLPKHKSPFFKINLDDFGTGFWNIVDNEKTVEQVGTELKAKFGEAIEPVFERLNIFIFQLRRQGFLELKDPKEKNDKW